MNYLKLLSVYFLIILLTGCGTLRKLSYESSPNSKFAYVYGNFYMADAEGKYHRKTINSEPVVSIPSKLAMVLSEIEKDDILDIRDDADITTEYTIDFDKKNINDAYMIAISPGFYDINKLSVKHRGSISGMMNKDSLIFNTNEPIIVHFEPNKLYYIGDYLGYSKVFGTKRLAYREFFYYWKILGFKESMNTSTNILKSKYKNFKPMETINLVPDIKSQIESHLNKNVTE